jgi:hypothetical protein
MMALSESLFLVSGSNWSDIGKAAESYCDLVSVMECDLCLTSSSYSSGPIIGSSIYGSKSTSSSDSSIGCEWMAKAMFLYS